MFKHKGWFTGKKVEEQPAAYQSFDLSILDHSLHLLKATTLEVSEAAISASQVLEERLRKSERRFYAVIDAISDVVIVKDGDGRWKTMNKTGQDLFGWHHGEYHDHTSKELSAMYPAMKGALTEGDISDKQAWQKRSVIQFQEEITLNNQSGFMDIIKTPVYNEDGSRKELIIIGRNITHLISENKRNKACFTALNAASDIIFIVDRHERIYFCNDGFVDCFGYASYEDVVGLPIFDIIEGVDSKKIWKKLRQNKPTTITYKELYSLSMIPMMNGEPEPLYFIGTMKPLDPNK